jgi:serine/threonine-protein kinase
MGVTAPKPQLRQSFVAELHIEGAIASGRSGDWWHARCAEGPRLGVTWRLPPLLDEPERRLCLAARVAQLRSPHVTPLLAWGQWTGGVPLVVYDCAPVVAKPATSREPMPLLLDRALAICSGLAEAHRAGFLVEQLDEGCVEAVPPEIAPAGVRLRLPAPPALGRSRFPVLPPELIRQDASPDVRSEIWLLGELLFRLFCGRPSYRDEGFGAATSILNDPPSDPSELRRDLPPGLAKLLLACLDKDPARRPDRVTAVLAALLPLRSPPGDWVPVLAPYPPPRPITVDLDQIIAGAEALEQFTAASGSAPPGAARSEQYRLNHAAAYYARGARHYAADDLAAALADFERAHARDQHFQYAVAQAVCQLDLADPSAARQRLLIALAEWRRDHATSSPSRTTEDGLAQIHYLQGVAEAHLGHYAEAARAFSQALERVEPAPTGQQNPTRALARAERQARYFAARSVAQHQQGKYAEAVADCDEALRLQPDCAEHYFSRGLSQYALGKFTAAIADFSAAIARQPDCGDYYHCRSLAHARRGQAKEAAADAQTAQTLGFSVARPAQ